MKTYFVERIESVKHVIKVKVYDEKSDADVENICGIGPLSYVKTKEYVDSITSEELPAQIKIVSCTQNHGD